MTERRGSRSSVGNRLIIGGMIAAPVIGAVGWMGLSGEARAADHEMRRQALIAAASLTPDPSNDSAAKLQNQRDCIGNGGKHGSFLADEMIECLDGTGRISEKTLPSIRAAADAANERRAYNSYADHLGIMATFCVAAYAAYGAMHIAREDR